MTSVGLLAALFAGAAPSLAAEPAPDSGRWVSRARELRLGTHPGWLRLGHYLPTLRGGWKSQIDGPQFFLADDGKTDPETELEATLRALFAPADSGAEDLQALCTFPARAMWLREQLPAIADQLPEAHCPKLSDYLGKLRPASVTLIFSSYYLNNPVSAFGHTFLRVNSTPALGQSTRQELLDYGVDYSATADTSNAVLYALKGLFGMFPGHFSAIPYYYKVRKYNDYESRDLWEYELSLSPKETYFLVTHLWELGQSFIDYWYLTENCSYHILGALEAVSPDFKLIERLSTPVLPANTVKAVVEQPGLVRDIEYRPSIRTQFRTRLRDLTSEQVNSVAEVVDDPNAPIKAEMGPEQAREVYDAALDLVEMRYFRELIESPTGEASQKKHGLLGWRAALGVTSPELVVPFSESDMPHLGHGSRRIGSGYGYSSDEGSFVELDFRLALHDLADPTPGYPESAQIEFLPLRLRYFLDDRSLHLEDLYLLRVISLAPIDRFERRFSWKIRVGATTVRDAGCEDSCNAAELQTGAGAALAWFDQKLTLYATADTALLAAPDLDGGIAEGPFRLGLGPGAGLRLRLDPRLVALASGQWLWLPAQDPKHSWDAGGTLRWNFLDAVALSLEVGAQPENTEGRMLLYLYF